MYVLCLINISCFGVKTFQGLPSISFGLHCTLLLFTDLILCTHRELLPHCKLAPTGLNLGTKQCPILPPSSLQAPALFHSGPHLHQKEVLSSQTLVGGSWGCLHPFGVWPSTAASFPSCAWNFTKIFWGSASVIPPFLSL